MATDADNWRTVVNFAGADDPVLLIALGKAVLDGVHRIEQLEKFTPIEHYSTHFPLPNGDEWHVTVRRHT